MLAWCELSLDADSASLLFNRLTILGVCVWGVTFCVGRACKRDGSLVPRWMWAIPTATMGVLGGLVTWFIVSCNESLSVWQRTVYGAMLVWSIAGLLTVIVTGHVRLRDATAKARETQRKLNEAAAALRAGRGDE